MNKIEPIEKSEGVSVSSMCPAVAMGLVLAQSGELSEEVAVRVKSVSDLMIVFAREERLARLAQLDEMIAASRVRRRMEGE